MDHVELFLMFLVRAVGEVQAGDVQTCAAHIGEDGFVAAGRADGTDDLRFSHDDIPLSACDMSK